MAIIKRSQLKQNKQTVAVTEQEFLSKAEDYPLELSPDLTQLSLDELVKQFIAVNQQLHLLKGRILLEARSRFISDKEFGQWISTHPLCVGRQQYRNRLMHLAAFFDGKDMEGISITAAYEISSPANQDKAERVYEQALGKNLPVKAVQALLSEKVVKDAPEIAEPEPETSPKPPPIVNDVAQEIAIEIVDRFLNGNSNAFKRDVLQKAIAYLDKELIDLPLFMDAEI